MKLAGTVPEALAGFAMLETLNLSDNGGLFGTLPEILCGLNLLKTFDVSYCSGISGSLPPLYAAMSALEGFYAVNCSGLQSIIPPSWVMLNGMRFFKISNSNINGTLPDWDNPITRRMATLVATRAADKAARSSAGGATAVKPIERKRLAAAAKRAAASLAAAAAGDVVGWSKLEVMLLPNNRLEGTVPASYSGLLNLTALDLSGNGPLSGSLPTLGKAMLLQVSHVTLLRYQCCFMSHRR
jgi:hypothetical protein